ncbi:hypothetical protein A1OO_04520 [Enterovibrio norvegicus FF-33]|uniref:hypothetical protein n=1 Tax=Enterovibrio norvegicus TaxID=188144 RepID=UPI00031D3569|nr:hypothetical protein [Enterovibrio norvegicus]OEE70044.1 hypothetical protein A1OO_04520 [Enterovibrio norvegicus FF-33]
MNTKLALLLMALPLVVFSSADAAENLDEMNTPDAIPPMSLQPDPMPQPALEPGHSQLPQAVTDYQLQQDEQQPYLHEQELNNLKNRDGSEMSDYQKENLSLE